MKRLFIYIFVLLFFSNSYAKDVSEFDTMEEYKASIKANLVEKAETAAWWKVRW